MKNKTKNSLIKNAVFVAVIAVLFITGAHTEVLAFVQRGILQTGLMNPKVEQPAGYQSHHMDDSSLPEIKEKADLNLRLVDAQGKTMSLEDFQGKAIFLNVWATWCPPCIAEMPGINELYKDVKDQNVEFVMLSVDEDFGKAVDFRENKNFEFNIYQLGGPMPSMYASRAIPTTYVIDAEGNLVLTHKGMGDFDTKEFREFLARIQ